MLLGKDVRNGYRRTPFVIVIVTVIRSRNRHRERYRDPDRKYIFRLRSRQRLGSRCTVTVTNFLYCLLTDDTT